MMVKVSDVLDLNAEHIRIKDPAQLETKLQKIKKDGKDQLHLVADFDCTLTKQRPENGRKLLTSFGMFCECPSVPEQYKSEDKRLADIYKPIEVDPNLSLEEKSKHMVKWYSLANDLLQGFRYPMEELKVVSKEVALNLRDGVAKMFMNLNESQVPVLVFSAGLGDAVVSVLESTDMLTPNVKIVSNFLNFNEDGFVNGMKGDIIHVFNKNEAAIRDTEYFKMIKNKKNVLLMGDTLGDAKMADGLEHSEAVIKIGYLFHNIEGNLPLYMDAFDIVLIDDQTVDVANSILQLVL